MLRTVWKSLDKARQRRVEGEAAMETMLKSGLSHRPTNYCSGPLHLSPGFPDPTQRKDDMLPTRNVAGIDLESPSSTTFSRSKPARDVRENLATLIGEAEVPIPTIYNTILIAPPISLEDKLQFRGGNFPGSSPSAPDPEGADWLRQDNTFERSRLSSNLSEAREVELC